MATKTFTITTTAPDTVPTDAKGHAEAAYTVTNTSSRPVRGMASAAALDSTKQEWLEITGETDRDFAAGSTQQFVVKFQAPVAAVASGGSKPGAAKPAGGAAAAPAADATADKHGFRLVVANATNPDEDFTEGQIIRVELPKPPPPKPNGKPFPKWIFIPIAVVLLLVVGVVLFLVIPGKKNVAVPNVVGMTLEEANAALSAANLSGVEQEVRITGKSPAGQVIEQNPTAESSPVPKGTEVQLITEGTEPLVEVPDVTKRLFEDAKGRLTEKGLEVVQTSTDLAEGLQPNQVVSQTPAAGQQVKKGSTVEVVIAVQRQITVPDVTFRPKDNAQQLLTAAGLKFVMKPNELAPPNVAPGNIKSQNPAAGEKVPPGAIIELVAAAQPITVPNVIGKTVGQAQTILQQNGLELGNVGGNLNETNANTVLINSQTPASPTQVARGSRVDVAVPNPCFRRPCFFIQQDFREVQQIKGINLKMRQTP
jgi:beta-lactam-binding protein with PASTA domain